MTRAMPRSRSADQRYYGVVEALVEEVDGDDEARVKLRFPWFDEATVTDWCRVSQLYAGNGYGSVFVPEKGDEVLVAFVHGDMRFPIVLGGLYNGADKPPTARTGGRDQKMIRTKHGHQVLFDDQQSQAAVRITSAAGHVVELDDAGKAIRVRAAQGGTVSVVADGAITLESKDGVTIDAPTLNVKAQKVSLGDGAGQSVPLGDALVQALNLHTHPVPSLGTSGPPTPLTGAVLSRDVKTR
jgi:uncharacterized protein involved in type VI secretion and phage assembly